MFTGGLSTWEAFDLSLDRLTIILTIKGLPYATQVEIFKRFDTYDVNLDNMQKFLDTLSTASFTSKSNINKISKPKQKKKRNKQLKGNVNPVGPSSTAARAANQSVVVKHGKCTCCLSDRSWHMESVKRTGLWTHEFFKLFDRFFHSKAKCHTKNSNSVGNINQPTQEVVESAPVPGSVNMMGHKNTPPTPHINVDVY